MRVTRLPNAIFIGLIKFYRMAISPYFPSSCRFEPTCSSYAMQAFQKYHFFKAIRLSAWRVLRCNPFSSGGKDPLP
ncbi:MAG: membrane protein insertion efficiency factor YidD [Candidatus Cloacimonetes bacterium]|nr:membrane protein insertion efficiency factor YidD [Candidatus Cloacimonadota bacterium]